MEKNIELAIEKEREYLERKVTNGDNTANIYDYLGLAGYDDLEEYFRDKTDFLWGNLEWDIDNPPVIDMELTMDNLRNEKPTFFWLINTGESYAFIRKGYADTKALTDKGLKPVEIGYEAGDGGLILSFDGDLRVYISFPDEIEFNCGMFLVKMCEYFNSLGMNSICSGNDILVNGRKVCGSASFRTMGMNNFVYQVSFTDNSDLIEEICGVKEKRPGFIDNSVLDPITLKNKFVEWLQ